MTLNSEELVSEIRNSPQYRYRPSIYLMEKKIPQNEWLPIIRSLYDKYEKDYIQDIVEQLTIHASTGQDYIDFLSHIASKNSDLFICPFKRLNEIDHALALEIYRLICDSNSGDLRFASGMLLYYIARKNPELIFKEISDNQENMDLAKRTALVMSLQDVAPWRNDTVTIPQYVKDFIVESSKFDDERLRIMTVKTAIIRYDLDKLRFRPIIESFIDKTDINKILVCQIIEPNNCPDADFDLSLIRRCSNTTSLNVIQWLMRIIGGKLFISEIDKQKLSAYSLDMIKRWSSIDGFSRIETQFAIETIGNIDVERAMSFMETWIQEENNETIIASIIPKIIYQLYCDKETELFGRISSWQNRHDRFAKMWFLIIKKILDEIYHFTNHKLKSADNYISKSLSFAEKLNIDVNLTRESIPQLAIEARVTKTLSLLETISIEGSDKDNLALLKSHKNYLSLFLHSYQMKEKVVNLIYDTLREIVKNTNIEDAQVGKMYDKSLSSKVVKCVALIESIHKDKKTIDSDVVMSNLKLFPNMIFYLGEDWFQRKCSEENCSHDLIHLLSKVDLNSNYISRFTTELSGEADPIKRQELMRKIEFFFHIQVRLNHINNCFNILSDMERGRSTLIKRLKNEDEYYQTISELEVGSAMTKGFKVTLQGIISDRPVDILAISQQNQRLIFEITSLDTLAKLKYMNFVPNMKNKVKSIILEKIDNQLRYYPEVNIPIVLVIDKSRAYEIGVDDVFSALYGSIGVEFIRNENNLDEPYSFKQVRIKNSINHNTELARRLSAVILYESVTVIAEQRVKISGEIIRNPDASIPLNDAELEDIKTWLFQ